MYNVSNAFKIATTEPAQTHRLTGTIGSVSFDESNIVAGSFNIQKQSTDTSDVVLGSAYIGQLTATFTGINISRQAWIGAVISPIFGLYVNNAWETVPLGLYIVKKATHTAEGVEVTAYDYMSKFDKIIKRKKTILGITTDSMWTFIDLACTKCHVILGMTKAQIDALPNGYRSQADIEIYGDANAADFANDIETYRDLLFWCAQTMGCFCTVDRAGQLIFKQYNQNIVETISDNNRLSGASFEDYTTHYTGVYFTDMDTNEDTYYGYDVAELQAQIAETTSDLEDTAEAIDDNTDALVALEEAYAQGQITEQEYLTQKAELQAERKTLDKTLSRLEKRLKWLQDALAKAQAEDDGATMDCGPNPFLQYSNITKRDNTRKRVLAALDNISYTPFQCSLLCGAHYDLGDVIYFTGGHADDDICCVMAWSYTHNQGTEIQGFGVDPSQYMVKSKARKEAKKATSTAVNTGHTYVAQNDSSTSTGAPRGSKAGDIWIKTEYPHKVDEVTKTFSSWRTFNNNTNPNRRYAYDTFSMTCRYGNFLVCFYPNTSGGSIDQIVTGPDTWDYYSVYGVFKVPYGSLHPQSGSVTMKLSDVISNITVNNWAVYNNSRDASSGYPAWNPPQVGCWSTELLEFFNSNSDTSVRRLVRSRAKLWDYYSFRIIAIGGTYEAGSSDSVSTADYVGPMGDDIGSYGLSKLLADDAIDIPDVYEGQYTSRVKYNENNEWKDLKYVGDVDSSEESGGTTWNGLNLNSEKNTLSLKPNVMRAWYKADPPQTARNFSQFCVRYTGKPDSDIEITPYANFTFENKFVKTDDDNAFKIKCGGVGGSGKYCVYEITGLVSGTRYYFNFAANWGGSLVVNNQNNNSFGVVFNDTGVIASDDFYGVPDSWNEDILYYAMKRTTTKNYVDFSFVATASTMYMFVVTSAVTGNSEISLILSEFVISQDERKYIREIYLYDYNVNEWLKYKPFNNVTGSGDESGSVVTITPTLQSGAKVADFSIDGENGVLYAPDNSYILPIASANELGGIKVGQNLTIEEDGTLNAQGGTTIEELNDIGDVDIDSQTLANGQVLKYDATNQEWVNGDDTGGADAVELTYAQYQQLTPQQKADPTKVYYVTDYPSGGGGAINPNNSHSFDFDHTYPPIPSGSGVLLTEQLVKSDLGYADKLFLFQGAEIYAYDANDNSVDGCRLKNVYVENKLDSFNRQICECKFVVSNDDTVTVASCTVYFYFSII